MRWPLQFWIGLVVVGLFWALNWGLTGNRTAYLFFPLWFGYILTVDGLVLRRSGTSLLTRSRMEFVALFLLSAPAWWLFEFINRITKNWIYLGGDQFTGMEYVILSSISFSTVMPAVFETAELAGTFQWVQRLANTRAIRISFVGAVGLFGAGLLMLALTLRWPRYCYPFVWTSIYFLIEPINFWLGRPNLFSAVGKGDWRPVASLAVGALICGFFWELWNYYSYPKWIYQTPGAQFWHIFEMPLLGYGGYLPFALELYALRNLFWPPGRALRI